MEAFDIDDVAGQIKALYTRCLRIHPSGRYRAYVPPTRWAKVWSTAASQCLEYGLDPEALVHSLLDERTDGKVWPNQLLGERAVQRTRAYMDCGYENEKVLIESQLAKLQGLANTGANMAEALMSYEEDFSSSMRFAFAVQAGLTAVASSFREPARQELRLNRRRLEAMRDLLPKAFIDEVQGNERPTDLRAN